MLWPAGYCYFQLFAVLAVTDAACASLSFLLPISESSDRRLKQEK